MILAVTAPTPIVSGYFQRSLYRMYLFNDAWVLALEKSFHGLTGASIPAAAVTHHFIVINLPFKKLHAFDMRM